MLIAVNGVPVPKGEPTAKAGVFTHKAAYSLLHSVRISDRSHVGAQAVGDLRAEGERDKGQLHIFLKGGHELRAACNVLCKGRERKSAKPATAV